jgi:hypothetical protein
VRSGVVETDSLRVSGASRGRDLFMRASETIGSSELDSDQFGNSGKSIQTFVISWYGRHDNAERIIRAVASTSDSVKVIYSDIDSNMSETFSCPAIRRPNDLFFADKFQACINSCDADILLIIHADCDCDNWSEVPEHCRRAVEQNPNIGVWAPLIDFTDWSLDRTEIDKITNSPFSVVAQTDAIVFGLTRQIVDRMRKADLGNNTYGWGIDLMYNYYTYSIGKFSVVDRSLRIQHPCKTAYSAELATNQQIEFLKQLTVAERAQSCLLDAIVRLRDSIKETRSKEWTLVADAKQDLVPLNQQILETENHVKRRMMTRVSEAVRFWIVDLLGDTWDRHRREL